MKIKTEKEWVLYILECKDGSLYTGITDDFPKRLAAHSAGKGAKYTRDRGPFTVRYMETCESHSAALRREYRIKCLTRAQKLNICTGYCEQSKM